MGENIGAAARVMLNFGLTDLRVIAPRDGWPNPKAVDMAKNAKEVLDNAHIFDSLKEAMHDIHHLYATTARPRDMEKPVKTARETINKIYQSTGKSAIMFGPERTGLTNEELTLASAITIIPVAPEYTSLNLAQSVAIMCYEFFATEHQTLELPEHFSYDAASKKEIGLMLEHLTDTLDRQHFFKVPEKREKMLQNIFNIFTRIDLNEQEVRTLRGIFKSLHNNT